MTIPSLLLGKIIETDLFEEVINHLSPNTIIFCDLDNTLIEANQQFGSVQWGDNHKRKLIELGHSPKAAEEILRNLWLEILPIMPMRLVDIERLQELCKIYNKKNVSF